jgi:hypothetical protein
MELYTVGMNRVLAVAPQEVLALTERTNDIITNWEDQGERGESEWSRVRNDFQAHVRALAGAETPKAEVLRADE